MSTALDQAMQLVEQAERDPVVGVKNASKLVALLRRVRHDAAAKPAPESRFADRAGQFFERVEKLVDRFEEETARPLSALGVTHIVRVPSVPALSQASPESGQLKIEWPGGEGVVRSIFAGTIDGDRANLSRVSVKIAINGSDELFTTGVSPAFVPLTAFQADNHNWFRLKDYLVTAAQRWTVAFTFEAPGPAPVTPFLLFGFARRH